MAVASKICGKGNQNLAGRRDVAVLYRGTEVSVSVGDHVDEVDLKVASLVKETTLGRKNGVVPLAFESACFGAVVAAGGDVPDDIPGMRDYTAARTRANDFFSAATAKSSSEYMDVLNNKGASLKAMDRTFSLEIAMLRFARLAHDEGCDGGGECGHMPLSPSNAIWVGGVWATR